MNNEVNPTFKISARIWWYFTWKTILFSIPLTLVFSFIGTMIGMALTGGNAVLSQKIGAACSLLIFSLIAIMVIQSCLNENFGKYRVSLIEQTLANDSTTEKISEKNEPQTPNT